MQIQTRDNVINMYDVSAIKNYILFLRTRFNLSVTVHSKEYYSIFQTKYLMIFNIHDFDDKGKFLKELLEIAIITAETPELEENAKRLKRYVLPLLGRVYFTETNRLTPKEPRKYCGFTTCMSVLEVLISQSMIDDGIMTFSAEI